MAMSVIEESPVLPLSLVAAGESAKLVAIRDTDAVRKRLSDLGLGVGVSVRVVKSDPGIPMILAFKHDARLAVGRATANRILVTLQPAEGR